ncbi:unnamed protein product [Rhizophagus irregularis]|nr:unnamed protein product [Rhizophagus irregularis]
MVMFSDNVSESKWDFHVKLMSLFLTNSRPSTGYRDVDYDHRFFYISENCCYCASGFVQNCMADYFYEKGKWKYSQIRVGLDVLRNSKEILQ